MNKSISRMIVLAIVCHFASSVYAAIQPSSAAAANPSAQTAQQDYESLKNHAEELYARHSYQLAHEMYAQAVGLALPAADLRWVKFRLADTRWRAQAGTETSDSTRYEEAAAQLEELVRDVKRLEERDRVWAEVQESLGDFWWVRANSRNWSAAWQHYQLALDWWAGTENIELARSRYLDIVHTIAKPEWAEPYYYYGYYGNVVPLEVLENVLKIAPADNDKAYAHYLIAMTIRNQGGDWDQRQRASEEFELAIQLGRSTDWYDDALYYYAEWMAQNGRVVPLEDGQYRQEPDYVKAVELFRRFLQEHQKGESRYFDQAKQQLEQITKPSIELRITNIFLPDSEVQFLAAWRNVKTLEFALYPVNLSKDVVLANDQEFDTWVRKASLTGAPLKTWSKETNDKGDYVPAQETMRLEKPLPVGAYILEAKGSGTSARELILITDLAAVIKTSGEQALVYVCESSSGAPVAGAQVKLWEHARDGNEYIYRMYEQTTSADGIAVFRLGRSREGIRLLALVSSTERQTFSAASAYRPNADVLSWRIYALTDRPAYRPLDTVQWKITARRYDGSVYSTPSGETVEYEITDPRGSKVKTDTLALNAFGSGWGLLALNASMPLGEYRVAFWDAGRKRHLGAATLFRLEEYKLPEFKVEVQTPEADGKKKAFRLGEKVEATIAADYYFGGPVANATVEVLVTQNPFQHSWYPSHEYPWFYEDIAPRRWDWGQGQVVKRELLKTDASGKAAVSFDTPRNYPQDVEYRIEARVVDSSRREITGSGNVRVSRQRYYVHLYPEHWLHRPQDKATVKVKALDANDQPVQVEGKVKITRDLWIEVWNDSSGREVKGEALKALRKQASVFPPKPEEGKRPWRLKFQGYQHDDITTLTVKTDAQGEAEINFTPPQEGYYRLSWVSEDKGAGPVKAETTLWVATEATTELGYRQGGIEILVDKDTFHAGQTASIMLTAPTNDRYVLFSVEGDDLYSYQLVHLTGTVKLIQLPIEEKHVPNIFLSAAMVSDGQLFMDNKQVVVPPVEQFLDVAVSADKSEYRPQEQGLLTITTKDHNGKPVSAEVGLGVVDESVYYIQQDYAQDPRQFFYGEKRRQQVQTGSTFQFRPYRKLIEGEEGQLVDESSLNGNESFDEAGRAGLPRGKMAFAKRESRGGYDADRKDDFRAVAEEQMAPSSVAADNKSVSATGKLQQAGQEEPAVQVRSDFRETIFWKPDVTTGEDGKATVQVTFPDSLTTWRSVARVATQGNQFGVVTQSVKTQLPLIIRLQAPRFFVVGDKVVLSAVINNNTGSALTVTSGLKAEGLTVKGEQHTVEVPAHGETRVDWTAAADAAGEAKLTVTARAGSLTDGMERVYPVYEHGIEKFLSQSGKVRTGDAVASLELPSQRRPGSTHLTVQVTPSLAVTMLDALPYLLDYPYGCVEQTMSRFLPAVVVAKTLNELGVPPEAIAGKLFGGIEQASADKTHPNGKKDLKELDRIVREGLDRLYDFQHADGGWGWWKEGESDHFMTAYVVWGLSLAKQAGLDVRLSVLEKAAGFLDKEIVEEETNYDMQAWMLHALTAARAASAPPATRYEAKAFENLWNNRDRLNAYTRSLLALSAHYSGKANEAGVLIENLENGVKEDKSSGTAHWGQDGIYWRWSDGGVEGTAFALQALLAVNPQHRLVDPVVNWLIKNRRGAQWNSTRDTAITVLALNGYLKQSNELSGLLEYAVEVNGQTVASRLVTEKQLLQAPSRFAVDPALVRSGQNEIRIRRKNGSAPIYYAVEASFFSQEEPVTPAGNEIFVRRQYYKLVGRPTLLKGYVYDKRPLNDGETVKSGERIEAVLTIEAKNNYEYLVFEDLKPAGFEAVEIRSGEALYAKELKSGAMNRPSAANEQPAKKALPLEMPEPSRPADSWTAPAMEENTDYTGRTRWVYQELRDRKTAFFLDKLPEGFWEIRYDLRAEVPGEFHALPVTGYAMYVPEIRCNSSEVRVKVEDR